MNLFFIYLFFFCRERKREREREDLWKKLETLSLTNAKKEGISLDLINHMNSSNSSATTSSNATE